MSQSRIDLKRELQDEEYRYAYAEDFLNAWVATQLVVLREQRGLSQKKLGELIGTKQPGVSRLEDVNHSSWKTETLKRVARALGVRLKISFETFGTLLDEDVAFNGDFLRRPEFRDDPAFAAAESPETEAIAARVGAGAEREGLREIAQVPADENKYTELLNRHKEATPGGSAPASAAAAARQALG